MDAKVCIHTGVKFLLLILTISGGFRLALTKTLSLPKNVTQFVTTNVSMECSSESLNSTKQPSWFKYDHGKILIYNATSSSNVNSSKYSIGTGNKTLTVMNVQLSDAATYCCNDGGLDDHCSNVVVIYSEDALVKPWYGIELGDTVNLTCTFSYNAPTKDRDAPFPLSDDQDPKLRMFIGQTGFLGDTGKEEIIQEPVVDVATVPHRKTISINKTVVIEDLDRDLECRVGSTKSGHYSVLVSYYAQIRIIVIYPNNAEWPQDVYSVNDVFMCIADRFPFLNVTWTDESIPNATHIISTGLGNASAKVLAPGKYYWTCSITSPLGRSKIYHEFSFRGSAGVISRSILSTAGCMLFIAFIIF